METAVSSAPQTRSETTSEEQDKPAAITEFPLIEKEKKALVPRGVGDGV